MASARSVGGRLLGLRRRTVERMDELAKALFSDVPPDYFS